jgi:hypothetical protein
MKTCELIWYIFVSQASIYGWHIAFGLIAALLLISSLPYIFFVSLKIQTWNDDAPIDKEKKDSKLTHKPQVQNDAFISSKNNVSHKPKICNPINKL